MAESVDALTLQPEPADAFTDLDSKLGSGEGGLWKQLIDAAKPTAEHRLLEALAGSWEVKSIFTPGPGADPIVSNGAAEVRPVIDGRYMQISAEMLHEGVRNESLVHLGFDTRSKQYTLHAMDCFGSYATDAAGTFDLASKTFTFKGKVGEPSPIADEPWREYEFEIQIELLGSAPSSEASSASQPVGSKSTSPSGLSPAGGVARPTMWRQTNRTKLQNGKWFTSTVVEYRRK